MEIKKSETRSRTATRRCEREMVELYREQYERDWQIEHCVKQSERYYLKAMNCPHHHRIFAAEPRSYRDLPLRLAEYGTCYRYEQSGELFGLMRVRSLNMNDAHIYCTPEQFAAGVQRGQRNVSEVFQDFRHREIRHALQHARPVAPDRRQAKFVNEPELWKQTEDMVRRRLD